MRLSEELRRTVQGWRGPEATEWVGRLPELTTAARDRWGIEIGEPFEPGGATSYVAPATLSDGTAAVYKCTLPHVEAVGEARALTAYDGDGAVMVLASEPETFEMLLEWCEPGFSLWDEPSDNRRIDVATGLMRRLWRDVPTAAFTELTELAGRWADVTERRLATTEVPWVTGPIERGAGLLRTLPQSADRRLLLHQDLHPGNILAAQREPWLVIDPKPVVGDPAFEPIQLLVQQRGRVAEPPDDIERRIGLLGDRLGLDPERIALWAIARCGEWSMWSWEHGRTIDAAIEYTWARALDALV